MIGLSQPVCLLCLGSNDSELWENKYGTGTAWQDNEAHLITRGRGTYSCHSQQKGVDQLKSQRRSAGRQRRLARLADRRAKAGGAGYSEVAQE